MKLFFIIITRSNYTERGNVRFYIDQYFFNFRSSTFSFTLTNILGNKIMITYIKPETGMISNQKSKSKS